MGDLNYRIDLTYDKVKALIEKNAFDKLLPFDQVGIIMDLTFLFWGPLRFDFVEQKNLFFQSNLQTWKFSAFPRISAFFPIL